MSTMETAALSKTQERLALHELLRLGLARQQDLCLLQQVADRTSSLPDASLPQLFKECGLREDWRCLREAELLRQLADSHWTSVTESHVKDVLHQMDNISSTKSSSTKHAPYLKTSTSLPTHIGIRSLEHLVQSEHVKASTPMPCVGSMIRTSLPSALAVYAGRTSPSRLTPPQRPQQQQRHGSSTGSHQAHRHHTPSPQPTLLLPPSSSCKKTGRTFQRGGSLNIPAAPNNVPQLMTAEQLKQTIIARTANHADTVQHPQQHMERPASSPLAQLQTAGSGRFQKLLKLQGTLMTGLQQHAASGGAQAACSALSESVQRMQQVFQNYFVEAMSESTTRDGTLPGHNSANHSCTTRRRTKWAQYLQLGQLGLTPSDWDRLQRIRQQGAARTIQRAVRTYLNAMRTRKAAALAAARAAEAATALHNYAAIVIQKHWRGWYMRAHIEDTLNDIAQQRRCKAAQRVRRWCAAVRIQRAWRAYSRTLHILKRRSLMQNCCPTAPQTAFEAALTPQPQLRCKQEHEIQHVPQWHGQTAPENCPHLSSEQAVVLLQAAIRSWLVRSSKQLWWARSVADLHRRRDAHRRWQAHKSFVVATLPLQQQFIDLAAAEDVYKKRVMEDVCQQQASFQAAWDTWLQQQIDSALAQPLPKGWIQHTAKTSCQPCYLDTKTGMLHAQHPAVVALKSVVNMEHTSASAKLQARQQHAARDVLHVVEAAVSRRSKLLDDMFQRHAQQNNHQAQ